MPRIPPAVYDRECLPSNRCEVRQDFQEERLVRLLLWNDLYALARRDQ